MYRSFSPIFYLFIVLLFSACIGQSTQDENQGQSPVIQLPHLANPFPYQLTDPDTIYILPEALYEVSGLSYHQENQLAMIEDEKALLFIYDLTKGEVIDKRRFGKDADYEGLEKVGDKVYALKSDGDVFEIQDYGSNKIKSKKFETCLGKSNDTEGLTYDPINQQLLISCKASPYFNTKKYKGHKAIYAFDLVKEVVIEKPFMLIDRMALKNYFESRLTPGQKWPEEKITFNPSAIAVHPILDEIYILASTGKLLVSVNRKGEIRNAFHLDSQLYKHPEGICFLPDGTLFISNEGDAGKPNLLKFSLQN